MKTGGRLVKHARYYWLLLAEGHLNRRLFGDMLRRLSVLPVPEGRGDSSGTAAVAGCRSAAEEKCCWGLLGAPRQAAQQSAEHGSETQAGVACETSTTIIESEPWLRLPFSPHFSPIPGNGAGGAREMRFSSFWAATPLSRAAVRRKQPCMRSAAAPERFLVRFCPNLDCRPCRALSASSIT